MYRLIILFLILAFNLNLLGISQEKLEQINQEYPEIKVIFKLSDISKQIINIYERDPITKEKLYKNGQEIVVGYLRFSEEKDKSFSLQYIEIYNQFQGKGFAKNALKLFFKLLDSMNVAYLSGLLASSTPYAGRLYAEVGFEYDPEDIIEKLNNNIDPMELVKNNKATEIDLKMKRLKDTPLENNLENAFIRGYALYICKQVEEDINIPEDFQYLLLMRICSAIKKKRNDVLLITDMFVDYYHETNNYYKSLLDKTFSQFTCNDRPCSERLKNNY